MAISFATYAAQLVTTIDDFNRADEDPITGWTVGMGGGSSGFEVISNRAARQASNFGNVYKTGVFTGAAQIAAMQVPVLGNVAIYLRLRQPGAGTVDAYGAYYDHGAGTIELAKYVNDAYTTISSVSYTHTADHWIGIACVGDDFVVATSSDGSSWTDRVQVDGDTSYAGASGDGLAIEADGTTPRLDNVKANTITAGQTISVGQATETDTALPITVVQAGVVAPAAPVGQAYRAAGTYPSGVLTVPGATIRIQPLDGVWETLGVGRLKGITPEAISPSWSYPWGDDQLRFSLKVSDGATRPDLLPFTPVELEVAGQVVWAGRVIDVPTDDHDHQVTCQGWSYHLDDDAYEKAYVLTDMSGWRDMRSLLTTTLGEAGYCAAGQVSTGQGTVQVGFPDAYVAAAGASAGAILDLGPDSRAARVTIAWEGSNDNNSSPALLVDFIAANDPTGSGGESLNGGPFALTTWGASGTFTVTLTTPSRYLILKLYNPGGGTHTMSGDAWLRFTACTVYASTSYESGGASALLASQVVADALTRAPLLNQDTSLISTTSFEIPEFATAGHVTPRQVIEGITAYEAYQHRVAGPDRRTLEYRARPSSAVVEIGEWSGVQFSDGSVSGQEIYNKVIVQGTGPDGSVIVARRSAGNLTGAVYDRPAPTQPSNAGFETDASGWTATQGSLARSTTRAHSGTASLRLTSDGAGLAYVQTSSWTEPVVPGIRYRVRFWAWLENAAGTLTAFAPEDQVEFDEAVATTDGQWEELTFEFMATSSAPIIRFLVSDVATSAVVAYIDDVELQVVSTTLPDRRDFPRARTLPIRSAITEEVAQRFGDLWLAEKTRAPFAASINVTGNGVRRILGGQSVPPWQLGDLIGEKLRVNHRVDPDTGAVGRDGRIVAVTYSVDSGQASITLDERRDAFEKVLAKYQALVGG